MASTPKGKAKSRMNAMKHGLRATDELLLAHLNTRERNILHEIRSALRKDYKPKTNNEKLLVDRIAIQHFRLYRLYKIENLAALRTTRYAANCETIIPHLDRFARYDARIDRQLRTLHNRLCALYHFRRDYTLNYFNRKE
jgi:hypothetical protein